MGGNSVYPFGKKPVSVGVLGLKLKSDAHSIKFIALQIMSVTHFYDSPQRCQDDLSMFGHAHAHSYAP